MKKIVIVGGGFGGVRAALDLEKRFKKDRDTQIFLVDKRDYHLFAPNLFEAATSEEELVSLKQVKKSIALPFSEILQNSKVKFIQGECLNIDSAKKQVVMRGRTLEYDYLILASGSKSDYYDINGAKEFGIPLKTLADAFRIRNRIEFVFGAHTMDFSKKNLQFVIAGGGYTGLEVAGEMKGLLDFLSWKYNYPRQKIEIVVVEAASKLVEGFDDRLSDDVYNRLIELGVHVRVSSRVAAVDRNFVELMSGEKIAYDALIWTAGVKGSVPDCGSGWPLDRKARLMVNKFLQVQGTRDILALGDAACVLDDNGQALPDSAQDALDQGKYAAYALPYLMLNKQPPRPYKNSQHGFIVCLGGKWAVLDYGKFYFKGFFAYAVSVLTHLRYFISVVGLVKAIKYILLEVNIYSRND